MADDWPIRPDDDEALRAHLALREAQLAAAQDDANRSSSALEAVLARISAEVTAEAAVKPRAKPKG